MSSTGQAVGMVVGGVVGFFAGGNVALGASIGGAIGGYIDPPKGPKGRPPSASDLAVQTATYGAPLSDGYGTYGTLGNIFWVEGNTLRAEEHKSEGGKGGGPTGPSTYDIYGTFAVGFGEGEIGGYGRIWFGSKLVCDFRSSDVGTILATTENGGRITLYTGSPTQFPDPRIQADMGAANTPAYRGLHYIVVSDWPMADYGNSLMGLQIKAEIVRTATFTQYAKRVYVPDDLLPRTTNLPGASSTEYGYYNPRIDSGVLLVDKSNTAVGYEYAYTWAVDFEGHLISQTGASVETGQFGYIGQISAGAVTYDGSYTGTFKVAGADFKLKTTDANNTCHGMAVGGDGRIYALERVAGAWLFNIYDGSDLTLVSSGINYTIRLGDNNISNPCIPGTNITFCVEPDGVNVWTAQEGGGNSNFGLCGISPIGDLTLTHNFNTAFLGAYGRMSAIVAANGLCFGVNNGGGFYVFDRNRIINIPTVPLADIISARCLKTGLLTSGDINVTEITQEVRGYKIPTVASVRASLEPLQAAWPLDVIPNGYKLKFVPRGGASVATIDIGELGCVAGNDQPGVQITTSREMDSQLPREVQVTYLDVGREYDQNTGPGAKRWNTDAVNLESLELAIVMNATEAAQAEEVLLYMRWLERNDVSFVLPPTRNNLEPADVVTISSPTATYELRLTAINYLPDGRLECSAKFNNAAIYTSTAVAQEGLSTGQVLAFPGASFAALLDVPCVDSSIMDKPGILAAVCGYSSGWPGGTLFRSDDSGQTWNGVQGFRPPGVVMGLATNTIGAGSTHVVDKSNRLNVRFFNDGPDSISEAAMFSGGNHFAYGAHGRWEIIAAQNCTDEADGTTTISGLMRGRFGTEQYMETHEELDSVVLLDPSVVRFVGLNTASLNIQKQWRAVTNGRSIDTASDNLMTYSGVNLKPLSPILLNGNRNHVTNDWSIDWVYRTRTPVEPFSGISAPTGESPLTWDVEFWDAGHANLIRTQSSLASASTSYSEIDQIADFASVRETLYLKIYPLSATVGRGYPLITSITRKSITDPYIALRFFASRMQGSNGSTTFSDLSPNAHSMTAGGNTAITTSTYMVGNSSTGFDGTDDHIQVGSSNVFDWMHKGNESWTMVFRCRATVVDGTNYRAIWANFEGGAQSGVNVLMGPNGELSFKIGNQTGSYALMQSAGTGFIVQNQWHYVEISYDSTAAHGYRARIFIDGTLRGSQTGGVNTYDTGPANYAQPRIGRYPGSYNFSWIGQLQEMIIYRGAVLHTANYTPPSDQFNV